MDPDIRAAGKTAWMEAESAGHAETARLLSEHASAPDIFAAARAGSLETVRRIVESDPASVRRRSASQWTPLHSAVLSGREDLVRFLLEHGAEVNALDNQRRTPLHMAAEEGDEAIVRFLLSHGADVHGCKLVDQDQGWTPLHSAAIGAHLGVMRILLEHGADPTLQAEGGLSALDWANEAEAANWREAARLLKRV